MFGASRPRRDFVDVFVCGHSNENPRAEDRSLAAGLRYGVPFFLRFLPASRRQLAARQGRGAPRSGNPITVTRPEPDTDLSATRVDATHDLDLLLPFLLVTLVDAQCVHPQGHRRRRCVVLTESPECQLEISPNGDC